MTIPLHTVPGSELPELVWHHTAEQDAQQIVARFRPPLFDGWGSKPDGGLWTAVMRDYDDPYRSDWGEFSRTVGVRKEARYTSRVIPDPGARFVVVDSQADAVAVGQAFAGERGQGTLHKLLVASGAKAPTETPPDIPLPDLTDVPEHLHGALMEFSTASRRPVVDFTLLATHQYAGLWLTDRGRIETHEMFSLSPAVPSFWGWDVETVWFRVPELRVEDTRRWFPV